MLSKTLIFRESLSPLPDNNKKEDFNAKTYSQGPDLEKMEEVMAIKVKNLGFENEGRKIRPKKKKKLKKRRI